MSELIFVTGGAGFFASHIVTQLLDAGYRVRTTARGAKVAQLKDRLARFGDKIDVVDVPDITHGIFALDGVDAVIHTASPIPGSSGTTEQLLAAAIEGSLNILRQAHAAGIKRFIYTGSIAATWTADATFTDNDWYSAPADAALGGDPWVIYRVSKTEAEKAIWAYGEKHPELDIAVFNPAFLYGPLAEGFPIPNEPNWSALSTAAHLFRLIYPDGQFPSSSGYVDVRDAAKAHVLALNAKNPTPERRKRFPITSPYPLDWDRVLALLAEKRPELKPRLLSGPAPVYTKANTFGFTDLQRIEEVTGFKPSEYHSLESTVLDTIDSLLELEKIWISNGYKLQ